MKSMNTCTQCKSQFQITDQDRAFYRKIDVPEPKLCPDCRKQRRLTWRNEYNFYSRKCDLCGKATVSLFSQDKPYKVYCYDCWWSEKYNPIQYGREFDFSRPFFEQFRELQLAVPRLALFNSQQQNAEYLNHARNNKNCHMVYICFNSENILYTRKSILSKDIVDSTNLLTNCELVYSGVNCETCYNCKYIRYCVKCSDSMFLIDCRNCQNCFGCVGLRNKQYCWFNEQLTKDEYTERLAQFHQGSWTSVEEYKNRFEQHALKFPRMHSYFINCTDSVGDELTHCKSCVYCYDLMESEDVTYFETGEYLKDCMDGYGAGQKNVSTELLYEVHGIIGGMKQFCNMCYGGYLLQYCDLCQNSENCFGCVGLKSNKFCIFNQQYEENEYMALRGKIIAHMKRTGEYGEFFPAAISPFCYNESNAQDYFPLAKDVADAKGFRWQENLPGTYGQETIKMADVPDDISGIEADLYVGKILACKDCRKNYKLIPQELQFYKKMLIPIPRQCPKCRYDARMRLQNPRKLWHRQCMCSLKGHGHHADGIQCANQFETTYAPDRPEKVFCEQCYQKEVI